MANERVRGVCLAGKGYRLAVVVVVIAIACGGSTTRDAAQPQPATADSNADGRAAERAKARAEEDRMAADLERENGTCDDDSYDVRRVVCRNMCPTYFLRGAPNCDYVCPRDLAERRPDNPACDAVMACPTPPDRRVLACLHDVEARWPACDRAHPSLANPRCDGWSSVPGTVSQYERAQDGSYHLLISPCRNRGVVVGWRGQLRETQHGAPVAGTEIEVMDAGELECTAITLEPIDADVMWHSTRVWMSPP